MRELVMKALELALKEIELNSDTFEGEAVDRAMRTLFYCAQSIIDYFTREGFE